MVTSDETKQADKAADLGTSNNGASSYDDESASLLWKLRNDVLKQQDDAANSFKDGKKGAWNLLVRKLSEKLQSNDQPSSTSQNVVKRGPGRPKKSVNTRAAARWNDHNTELLLQLRFDTMKAMFEDVRNNIMVGEGWGQLAAELSLTTGKEFDSKQCQSKLRNLKRAWRQMQANAQTDRTTPQTPQYALLQQYLGRRSSRQQRSRSHSSCSNSHSDTSQSINDDHLNDNKLSEVDKNVLGECSSGNQYAFPRTNNYRHPKEIQNKECDNPKEQDVNTSKRQFIQDTATQKETPKRRRHLEKEQPAVDINLLSIVDTLKTVVNGAVASMKRTNDTENAILTELREQNRLLKDHVEEMQRQTCKINTLFELVSTKFQSDEKPRRSTRLSK